MKTVTVISKMGDLSTMVPFIVLLFVHSISQICGSPPPAGPEQIIKLEVPATSLQTHRLILMLQKHGGEWLGRPLLWMQQIDEEDKESNQGIFASENMSKNVSSLSNPNTVIAEEFENVPDIHDKNNNINNFNSVGSCGSDCDENEIKSVFRSNDDMAEIRLIKTIGNENTRILHSPDGNGDIQHAIFTFPNSKTCPDGKIPDRFGRCRTPFTPSIRMLPSVTRSRLVPRVDKWTGTTNITKRIAVFDEKHSQDEQSLAIDERGKTLNLDASKFPFEDERNATSGSSNENQSSIVTQNMRNGLKAENNINLSKAVNIVQQNDSNDVSSQDVDNITNVTAELDGMAHLIRNSQMEDFLENTFSSNDDTQQETEISLSNVIAIANQLRLQSNESTQISDDSSASNNAVKTKLPEEEPTSSNVTSFKDALEGDDLPNRKRCDGCTERNKVDNPGDSVNTNNEIKGKSIRFNEYYSLLRYFSPDLFKYNVSRGTKKENLLGIHSEKGQQKNLKDTEINLVEDKDDENSRSAALMSDVTNTLPLEGRTQTIANDNVKLSHSSKMLGNSSVGNRNRVTLLEFQESKKGVADESMDTSLRHFNQARSMQGTKVRKNNSFRTIHPTSESKERYSTTPEMFTYTQYREVVPLRESEESLHSTVVRLEPTVIKNLQIDDSQELEDERLVLPVSLHRDENLKGRRSSEDLRSINGGLTQVGLSSKESKEQIALKSSSNLGGYISYSDFHRMFQGPGLQSRYRPSKFSLSYFTPKPSIANSYFSPRVSSSLGDRSKENDLDTGNRGIIFSRSKEDYSEAQFGQLKFGSHKLNNNYRTIASESPEIKSSENFQSPRTNFYKGNQPGLISGGQFSTNIGTRKTNIGNRFLNIKDDSTESKRKVGRTKTRFVSTKSREVNSNERFNSDNLVELKSSYSDINYMEPSATFRYSDNSFKDTRRNRQYNPTFVSSGISPRPLSLQYGAPPSTTVKNNQVSGLYRSSESKEERTNFVIPKIDVRSLNIQRSLSNEKSNEDGVSINLSNRRFKTTDSVENPSTRFDDSNERFSGVGVFNRGRGTSLYQFRDGNSGETFPRVSSYSTGGARSHSLFQSDDSGEQHLGSSYRSNTGFTPSQRIFNDDSEENFPRRSSSYTSQGTYVSPQSSYYSRSRGVTLARPPLEDSGEFIQGRRTYDTGRGGAVTRAKIDISGENSPEGNFFSTGGRGLTLSGLRTDDSGEKFPRRSSFSTGRGLTVSLRQNDNSGEQIPLRSSYSTGRGPAVSLRQNDNSGEQIPLRSSYSKGRGLTFPGFQTDDSGENIPTNRYSSGRGIPFSHRPPDDSGEHLSRSGSFNIARGSNNYYHHTRKGSPNRSLYTSVDDGNSGERHLRSSDGVHQKNNLRRADSHEDSTELLRSHHPSLSRPLYRPKHKSLSLWEWANQ